LRNALRFRSVITPGLLMAESLPGGTPATTRTVWRAGGKPRRNEE
jgi:hypothetical protein